MSEEQSAAAVAEPEVAEPVVHKAAGGKKKPKRQPPYHVILWNDDDHTYQYVITMMQKLFGHPVEKGMQIAEEVDTRGRVIVMTTTRELAELKRDQIHAYGKDDLIAGCKGSMSATIEPSE
jgi:ATP-dependent Clp protease adaptor protein ClpS